MGWSGALGDCQARGGNLPSIHSAADNEKVKVLYQKANSWMWLGIKKDYSSTLKWSDNTPVDYTNFQYSPANGHCGYFEWDGKWGSSDCGWSHKYICVK